MTSNNPDGRTLELEKYPEKVTKLEQAFAIDATLNEALFYADISKTAYYNYLEKYPEMKDRFEALRNTPILKARETAVKKVGDSYANAMDYLQRKRRDEFAPSQKVEVEGKINITHILNNIELHGQTAIGQRVEDEAPLLDPRQERPTYQVLEEPSTEALRGPQTHEESHT